MSVKHLTDVELVDLIDGGHIPAKVREHLRACTECQSRADDLSVTLQATRDVPVPEPSPLFWDHLSQRVKAQVMAEAAGEDERWAGWQDGWRQLAVAALALVVFAAAVIGLGRWSPAPESATAPAMAEREAGPTETMSAVNDLPDVTTFDDGEPAEWVLLVRVADGITLDDAGEFGFSVGPAQFDGILNDLTDEQQRRLAELLRDELSSTES